MFDTVFRSILADVVTRAGDRLTTQPLGSMIVSIEGVYGDPEHRLVEQAVHASALHPESIEYIDRGVACLLAARAITPGSISLRAGGMAFATILLAIEPNVRSERAGGYGPFSGDDGGGYFIGRQLLYQLVQELDQRRHTEFGQRVRAATKWLDDYDPIRWIRKCSQGTSLWSDISELARVVIDLADEKEPTARRIVMDAAERFADVASRLAQRAPARPPVFVLSGGIARRSPLYVDILTERLRRGIDGEIPLRVLQVEPVVGCVFYALRQLAVANALCEHVCEHLASHPSLHAAVRDR